MVGLWTNNNITVTAPSGATTGYVVVSVNGVPSAGQMFTYTPSITSLSPIPVLADGIITIGGNNFGSPLPTDNVAFNGVSATINAWVNTSITAVVPGNVTAGTVVVSVNGVASNAFSFSLTSPYTFSLSYAPNGDVLTVSDSVNGNWVYAYDSFNRLSCSNLNSNGSCSSPTSGNPTYSYTYDRYGNRWQQNGPSTMLLSFTNSQNQMDGYSYDAAGNLLNDGNHSYVYDAENRIVQVDQGQTAKYIYDAQGQRVQKTSGGAVVAEYLHDLSGNTIVELNSSGVWTRAEIYAGGRYLATYGGGASGTTYFVQQDWVGTERARVLPNGDVYETCTSLPFGDGQTCSGGTDPSPNHFTGKERDSESGLDYFEARYDASSLGRFMTPDLDNDPQGEPSAVPYADLNDPQTLNLYSYVRNNPTTLTDPDGHCWGWVQALCNLGQRFRNEFTGYGFRTDAGVERRLHDAHKWLRENTPLNSGKQEQLSDKAILSLYDAAQAGKDSVIVDDGKGNEKINLLYLVPSRDVTGKVHGDLPDHVPDNWTREDLQSARDELNESIKRRNEEQVQKGEEGGHREKIRREKQLLRQIEKKLSGS
jgi:RHS repeat-associated protein